VSHLGDAISALIDGELSGADLDKANAHLASCERCRGEAAGLRMLKLELRALVAHAAEDGDLTGRLLSMGFFPGEAAGEPAGSAKTGGTGAPGTAGADVIRAFPARPLFRTYRESMAPRPRASRHRYLVWGAVSLAVVGGLGAAAFSMGGSTAGSGTTPGVVPQIELYNVEHAIDSGDVPFPGTSAAHATGRAVKQAVPRKP
jgi:anti-sigma factor RsiW